MSSARKQILLVAVAFLWHWAAGKVIYTESDDQIIVQNGYTYLAFNKITSSIDTIAADFSGGSAYGKNNLAQPFSLQVKESATAQSKKPPTKCGSKKLGGVKVTLLENNDDLARFHISNIHDRSQAACDGAKMEEDPVASEEWTISLASDERAVTVDISGQILHDASVDYILHGIYTGSPSLYGLFPQGVTQMMGNTNKCMGSVQPLSRAYVLGDGAAMDVIRHNYAAKHAVNTLNFETGTPSTVVFKSAHETFGSGIEDVLFGSYPTTTGDMLSAWKTTCWTGAEATTVTAGETWKFGLSFIPNNYDFPAYLLNNVTSTVATVPFDQLRAYLTGAYASPAGCLQSYYDKQFGTIAPTISHPDVGYSPDTNFFDPDNFISLSALLYSGDSYFMQQVKYVLQRTAGTMCGIGREQVDWYCNSTVAQLHSQAVASAGMSDSAQNKTNAKISVGRPHKLHSTGRFKYNAGDDVNTRTGQLMHHFVSLVPTYESIAGSEQLGPNIFWTFSVLRYIAITQDADFANEIFPYVDLSTKYVLSFYDAEKELFRAPGPLWIDVIIRENYTSDSNGMLVPYLQKVADFYDYMHVDAEFAAELRALSETVSAAIRTQLFDTQTQDHFITQINPDGSIRDFVDYDSNLMTVAFGIITDEAQIHRVLKRVDSGPYTHVRGTWCSEIPYSGDAMDCYIVGGDVCGDSVVTLARIGWVDALARKRIGDLQTFQELLLNPLQNDLLQDIWLYERYDAQGNQIRTPYYFEYPSLVVMMLREVQYGVDIGLNHVNIDPFPHVAYQLHLGVVSVEYAPEKVVLSLPGGSGAVDKVVNIGGMTASASYSVANSCTGTAAVIVAGADGVLTFTTKFADGCVVTAALVQ